MRVLAKTLSLIGLVLVAQGLQAAPGDLDPAFAPPVFGGPASGGRPPEVRALAVQSDGKILVGGLFGSVGGTLRTNVARLNADGTVDTSFNPGTGPLSHYLTRAPLVYGIGVQSDGMIVVAGTFQEFHGVARRGVVRLTSTGAVDPTFNPLIYHEAGASQLIVNLMRVQPDDRVLVGGTFTGLEGVSGWGQNFLRLTAAGARDTTFDSRYLGSAAGALALASNGQIVLAGDITSYNQVQRRSVLRIGANGVLDTTLDAGTGTGSGPAQAVTVDAEGRILLGGSFTSFAGTSVPGFVRLLPGGGVDTSFPTGSRPYPAEVTLAVGSGGKPLVGGLVASGRRWVARLESNGAIEPGFSQGPAALAANVLALAVLPDGQVLAAGQFRSNTTYWGIVKLQAPMPAPIYTFDALTVGQPVAGQDGWVGSYLNGAPVTVVEREGGSGRAAGAGVLSQQGLLRVNDANFSFPRLTGAERSAYLQFDLRSSLPGDVGGVLVLVGHDVEGDGILNVNEGVGLRYQEGSIRLDRGGGSIQQVAQRTAVELGAPGDWLQVRLVMDLGGEAPQAATVLYRNLTRASNDPWRLLGRSTLTLWGNLPEAAPIQWDALSIVPWEGYEIDNLQVGANSDLPLNFPTITSGRTITVSAYGDAVQYTLTADDATSLATGPLLAGLTFDPVSGLLAGVPTVAGQHTVHLIARNATGQTDGSLTFTVPPPPAPVAHAGGPYSLVLGHTLTLDGSASAHPNPGASLVEYRWDLTDDGTVDVTSTTPDVTLSTAQLAAAGLGTAGTFTVRLTVVDSNAVTGTATTALTVTAPVVKTWNGGSGDWFVASNWTPAGVPAPTDTVRIGGGTINPSQVVVHLGQLQWAGGSLGGNGSSRFVLGSNAVLTVSGTSTKYWYGVVTNAGRIEMAGGSQIYFYDSGATNGNVALVNLPAGVVDILGDNPGTGSMFYFNSGSRSEIVNHGTLRKSGGTGTATVGSGMAVRNAGSIDVGRGRLSFASGGGLISAGGRLSMGVHGVSD